MESKIDIRAEKGKAMNVMQNSSNMEIQLNKQKTSGFLPGLILTMLLGGGSVLAFFLMLINSIGQPHARFPWVFLNCLLVGFFIFTVLVLPKWFLDLKRNLAIGSITGFLFILLFLGFLGVGFSR